MSGGWYVVRFHQNLPFTTMINKLITYIKSRRKKREDRFNRAKAYIYILNDGLNTDPARMYNAAGSQIRGYTDYNPHARPLNWYKEKYQHPLITKYCNE